MKKLIFVLIPALMAFASCTKESINNSPSPAPVTTTPPPVTNTQGYVTVKCDNCKIDYGMPDQYKGYNIAGQSGQFNYTYTKGYNLQANVYALDHDQTITYTVFDTNGKTIFTNSQDQSVEGYWAVNVLLP